MPPTVYHTTLIVLLQALKAVVLAPDSASKVPAYQAVRDMLLRLMAVTPPPDMQEMSECIYVTLMGMPHDPDDTAWPALHEMCQDMLSLLSER